MPVLYEYWQHRVSGEVWAVNVSYFPTSPIELTTSWASTNATANLRGSTAGASRNNTPEHES
jgi:hypothetical protein